MGECLAYLTQCGPCPLLDVYLPETKRNVELVFLLVGVKGRKDVQFCVGKALLNSSILLAPPRRRWIPYGRPQCSGVRGSDSFQLNLGSTVTLSSGNATTRLCIANLTLGKIDGVLSLDLQYQCLELESTNSTNESLQPIWKRIQKYQGNLGHSLMS